jgi:aminoglycoside 6'-N-acetyltransferase I
MSQDSPQPAVRPPHPLALALIERLQVRPGARVLEIGQGSGRNTRALRDAGFLVVGYDGAGDRGAAALSTHDLLHGTVDEISGRLARIATHLEPGAPFYATFGSTRDARYETGSRIADGVYAPVDGDEAGVAHAYFDRTRLAALLDAHFVIEALDEREVDAIAGSWAHARAPLHGAVHWFALLRNGGSGVRALREGDVPAWLAMREALWLDADRDELAAEAHAFLDGAGEERAFVYEGDGRQLLGMLELSLRSVVDGCLGSPVPFVEAWYVDAASRGRGVGRALVVMAARWARAHGFAELASDTPIANEPSIAAHRALGFSEVERAVHFRMAL